MASSVIKNPNEKFSTVNFNKLEVREYADGRVQFLLFNGNEWKIITFGNETYKNITYQKTDDNGQTVETL